MLDSESAVATIRAGAQYLVSPTLSTATIAAANRYDTPTGGVTPQTAAYRIAVGAVAVGPGSALTKGRGGLRSPRR